MGAGLFELRRDEITPSAAAPGGISSVVIGGQTLSLLLTNGATASGDQSPFAGHPAGPFCILAFLFFGSEVL